MINEIQTLVDHYWDWLKSKTSLRAIGEGVEVTTPYLDRHNDYLQLYVAPREGRLLLTDGGAVLDDLRASGCDLKTKRRQELLNTTLNGFGVRLGKDGALEVSASEQDFSLKKHNLVQAMLAVNDLFAVAGATITSLFWEDVQEWLDANDVRYTPQVKFTGKSGYDSVFDFVIPASKRAPERLGQAINRLDKNSAERTAFSWQDIHTVRREGTRCFAVVNDGGASPSQGALDALRVYEVEPIRWSQRDRHVQELAS